MSKQALQPTRSAPLRLKVNSAIAFGLIVTLLIFKRTLLTLKIAPLRLDPCDAVGAFAVIAIVFTVIGSLVRAIRIRQKNIPAGLGRIYALRSHEAIVLAVFITLAADAVALGRHPAMWFSANSRNKLLTALLILTVTALAAQLLILAAQRTLAQAGSTSPTRAVLLASVITLAVLILVPEWPIDNSSAGAHILTVMVGAVVVLAPMRFLLPRLVPHEFDEHRKSTKFGTARERASLLVGVVTGSLGFWADEARSHDALPHAHSPVIVLVIAGLFVTYAFLAGVLGFLEI